MKSMKYVLILVFGLLSCQSSSDIELNLTDFNGNWNWTQTRGGLGFNIYNTPESIGKTILLTLRPNFTFSIFENGIEQHSGSFQISLKKSIYTGELDRFILFGQNNPYLGIVTDGIIHLNEEQVLEISDNHYDGVSSQFIKVE